jgi:hypothetical protein
MTYAQFHAEIADALSENRPPAQIDGATDVRPMVRTLSCISDTIVRSGLADLGQRELLRTAAERCAVLAAEPQLREDPDTLALCGEVIGYLSTVESCRLPVALPADMKAFSESLRWSVVGLASRAAFAQATMPRRRTLSPAY